MKDSRETEESHPLCDPRPIDAFGASDVGPPEATPIDLGVLTPGLLKGEGSSRRPVGQSLGTGDASSLPLSPRRRRTTPHGKAAMVDDQTCAP